MIKTQILQVKDFLDLKNPTGKLRKSILDFLKLDYTVYLDFENVEDLNYDFSKESLNILNLTIQMSIRPIAKLYDKVIKKPMTNGIEKLFDKLAGDEIEADLSKSEDILRKYEYIKRFKKQQASKINPNGNLIITGSVGGNDGGFD